MKLFKLQLIFLTIFFYSCSSDSNLQEEISPYFLNISTNNTPLVLENWEAVKDGDYFMISASKFHSVEANGNVLTNKFFILFHKDGTVINIYINDVSRGAYLRPIYNLKNRFNFNIGSIDEVNKKIELSFSGQILKSDTSGIYEDVSGSIFLPFENLHPNIPSIANYGTTCKLNNQNWRGLGKLGHGEPNQYFIQIFGDDEHSIELVLPRDNLQPGTHTYSGGIAAFNDYSINYLKYNDQNFLADEDFITSGNITITEKGFGYVKGTFSFSSYNSNTGENIVVSDGFFSEKLY